MPNLTSYADWKRPIDGAFAFSLKDAAPGVPAVGTRTDIRDVARAVLAGDAADRFDRHVDRWSGPEDVIAGAMPWAQPQLWFVETFRQPVTMADVRTVLTGTVLVSRAGTQTDYFLRDHHMIDVALYHWWTTGRLPRALLHCDRHSDWCKDSYLLGRRPAQAATWWALFEGLKRPDGTPVLKPEDVSFVGGRAAPRKFRDVPGAVLVPPSAEGKPPNFGADWVSLDLDYFQPSPQLRLASPLVRSADFQRAVQQAEVRVFCLSPQFTAGGDKVNPWTVQGGLHSSRRILALLKRGQAGLLRNVARGVRPVAQ